MNIERVNTERCAHGEGAPWSADEQALYYLDIYGGSSATILAAQQRAGRRPGAPGPWRCASVAAW